MTIWNLGSINADRFYAVPRIAGPGETLAATGLTSGLGGKGANQSVAAAKAGGDVRHIGCVGSDGEWMRDRLAAHGVDVTHVARLDVPTGHAIIEVAEDGENRIIIFAGANAHQSPERIEAALAAAQPGDLLLLQNETTYQAETARAAAARGMRVVYSAAPFDVDAVRAVLDHTWLLALNAVEAQQLDEALGRRIEDLPVENVLVTRGADGAEWLTKGMRVAVPSVPVRPVDTSGAGDTFLGYVAAGLDSGRSPEIAMRRAASAAALKVTRRGTADAIPSADEVNGFVQEANGVSSPQS